MTPAIERVRAAGRWCAMHEYVHDPRVSGYGEEAVERLGFDATRVCKTLVVSTAEPRPRLAVGVVPVNTQLDLKRLATALDWPKLAMADAAAAQRATGYVLGGIAPLGHPRELPVVVDVSVRDHETVFVSAGRRGLELELRPVDLIELSNAVVAPIARRP